MSQLLPDFVGQLKISFVVWYDVKSVTRLVMQLKE